MQPSSKNNSIVDIIYPIQANLLKPASAYKLIQSQVILKKIYYTKSMSVGQIILDPISILQMTNYFEKNIPWGRGGATYGFIYAKQVELKFLISLTAPLGTHLENIQQLLKRGNHFESIRKTKSKTTQSYFLQYDLVGLYLMRKDYEKQDQKFRQLSAEYSKLGAPFSLIVKVDEGIDVKFYKDNAIYPYTSEMQTNEKICVDSFSNQNSKSLVFSTIKKQTLMISHFNEKISQLLEKVQKNALSELELIELAEILDNYDRIKHFNEENKLKTLEALNYSVLVGLSVSKTIG